MIDDTRRAFNQGVIEKEMKEDLKRYKHYLATQNFTFEDRVFFENGVKNIEEYFNNGT